jgi:hypothetical protein
VTAPWRCSALGLGAEAFVKDDPFVKNGVVASYEIREWNEMLLG